MIQIHVTRETKPSHGLEFTLKTSFSRQMLKGQKYNYAF